ncbi:MAG: NAD-dependent epimerase/dehydratase family protein [bacterium]|nr:NAD-dependent epimerase/dehydratase family protein [bacterium]
MPELDGASTLVTGGAGFIGSHLVDALLDRGARVRVLDNFVTGRRENLAHLGDSIELVEGDLRDTDACRQACRNVELVFHQAAMGSVPRSIENPAESIAVNVSGTANILAAARDAGVRRVVFASSSAVYGDSPDLPKREGREGSPLSPYALSKKMCEDLGTVFHRCYTMEIVALRYFNVFGLRQRYDGPYAAAVPRFVRAYSRGQGPVIYGDGGQSRDFTNVADAVRANLLAAGAAGAVSGRAFNVASGRQTRIGELARIIRELTGGGPEPIHEQARAGDVRHSLADLTASGEALGYTPRHDVEAGLAALVEASRPSVAGAR